LPSITPFVRKLLIWNVAIFAAMFILAANREAYASITNYLMLNPDQWFGSAPFLPVWQFVTYGFMHSVDDPMHILMNMLLLFFLGSMLEQMVGARKFAVTYFGAMFAGALLQLVITKVTGQGYPTLGASGAVLGIVVAAAVLRPDAPMIFIIFPITLRTFALIIVGLDAFMILTELRDGRQSGTAHWVHLGGAIFGYFWAKKGWIEVDFAARAEAKKAQAQRQSLANDEKRLDELLARIKKDGIASLSEKEKTFLKRMSDRK